MASSSSSAITSSSQSAMTSWKEAKDVVDKLQAEVKELQAEVMELASDPSKKGSEELAVAKEAWRDARKRLAKAEDRLAKAEDHQRALELRGECQCGFLMGGACVVLVPDSDRPGPFRIFLSVLFVLFVPLDLLDVPVPSSPLGLSLFCSSPRS